MRQQHGLQLGEHTMEGLLKASSSIFTDFITYLFRIIFYFGLSVIAVHLLNDIYGDSLVIGATKYATGASSLQQFSPKFSGIGAPLQNHSSANKQRQDSEWLRKAKARLAKERKKMAEKARREMDFSAKSVVRNSKRRKSVPAIASMKTANTRKSAHTTLPRKFQTKGLLQNGMASFYGKRWNGRKTANGEIFNHRKFTAAHKTLSFGMYVRVVRKDNGKSVIVRINDRGPYVKGRVIDLSSAAAKHIGMLQQGVAQVAVYKATVADYLKQFMD